MDEDLAEMAKNVRLGAGMDKGTEMGAYALDHYTEVKCVWVNLK
ncbi:hypothetical protein [Bacillus sp. J33]|nr:hypothetical protein [Bacillus sp. J33]